MKDEPVKRVRFLVRYQGELRKLARLGWSAKDSSLYVIPYSLTGEGYAGVQEMPPDVESHTYEFTGQCEGSNPKMSLHESGRCHAEAGGCRTQPVQGRPFPHRDGGHVATVLSFHPATLPRLDGVPKGPPNMDLIWGKDDREWNGLHVSVHIYATQDQAARHSIHLKLVRPTLKAPLYVGIHARSQFVAEEEARGPGAVVIGGWATEETFGGPFLFVVAR